MKPNNPLAEQQKYNSYNKTVILPESNSILTTGSANIFLPLRIFLGISFVAAGVDKLLDPQFFDVNAAGYIGNQLAGFAGQSPIGFLLKPVSGAPLAPIFGAIVLVGELAIGIGTLLGLLSRAAAFFGFVLSIILWLSASWSVAPFFLGSDLPYAMGWLTLFLAGPHPILSLDAYLKKGEPVTSTVLPNAQPAKPVYPVQVLPDVRGAGKGRFNPAPPQNLIPAYETREVARRQFLVVTGAIMLAGGFTGVAWLKNLHDQLETPSGASNALALPPTTSTTVPATASPSGPAPTSVSNTPSPTQAASGQVAPGQTTSAAQGQTAAPVNPPVAPTQAPAAQGKVIAILSDIAVGGALAFTTPDTGEGGYIVHEKDGSVKAFSRTCTHEGCDVTFIQSSQIFACPCHGAAFDAKTGAVLRRPARQPLPTFKVQVDGSGNVVYTAQ